MGIKWDKVFEQERKQFEGMAEQDKFIYFLLLQFGSPYSWGKENPEGSDCSGAVCLALYAATGLLIRAAADDLYRRVFTKREPKATDIRAAFFIDGSAGKAVHAAGLAGDGVVLNSQATVYTHLFGANFFIKFLAFCTRRSDFSPCKT
jgi:murein DD-endopeptidase